MCVSSPNHPQHPRGVSHEHLKYMHQRLKSPPLPVEARSHFPLVLPSAQPFLIRPDINLISLFHIDNPFATLPVPGCWQPPHSLRGQWWLAPSTTGQAPPAAGTLLIAQPSRGKSNTCGPAEVLGEPLCFSRLKTDRLIPA